MNETPPRLALRGITKRFPGVVANHDVGFVVQPGEIHALLGENGAGKSTLVKIIYGVLAADEGEVLWDGEPAVIPNPKAARRLGIGMVFQHFSLFEALTVFENIALGMDEAMPRAALRARIDEILAAFHRQRDVLGHRECLEQREVLEHHADAEAPRLRRVAHGKRPAFPEYLAGVGLDDAVDDLDERALAGAVLAEQRVNLAGGDRKAYVVVRQRTRITLGDAPQLEQIGHRQYGFLPGNVTHSRKTARASSPRRRRTGRRRSSNGRATSW